jgi:SAM-dependent methyltransferase
MSEDHFGDDVAEHYDEAVAEEFDPSEIEATADLLAELAGSGAALELGIGTGRIALPLLARGVRVHGIDLSTAMVARFRAKSGAEQIDVTIGDFASTAVEGSFSLAYLVFNTIMNLTSQDEQIACFQNVARHLEPGGRFVIEILVPDLQRLAKGETIRPFTVTPSHLGFDEYDVVSQSVVSHHYRFVDGQCDARSIPFRYAWPAELDLMAKLAGMTLQERWAGWNREPFSAESTKHVSVWSKDSPGSDR